MKKNYEFLNIKRGPCIYTRKILSNTTLTMLEKAMYLATILLLQYRFHNHLSDGEHNAKLLAIN